MFTNKEKFKASFAEKLMTLCGKDLLEATNLEKYQALASLLMEHINRQWLKTNQEYTENGDKQIYYFCIEFLLGRMLGSNLLNMGIKDLCEEALAELGINFAALQGEEPDAGLGNGGLGRLAACYLDSMASLHLPGHGCGIRYDYGLFEQKIIDGYQVELPDDWLKHGNPWEVRRDDRTVEVKFGGKVCTENQDGKTVYRLEDYDAVKAVPYDMPMIGFKNHTVNTLRLWKAEPARSDFDFNAFNRGEYLKATDYKNSVAAISRVLYPNDNFEAGQILRLKQEYFFASAGVQSIVNRHKRKFGSVHNLAEKVAIHINDTHPALVIPELMRLLIDEEGLFWEEAWQITTRTMSYTNHTVLPEALEKWPIDMFKKLLPRIFILVHEINERFCACMWDQYPGEWQRIRDVAITADGFVHMAHLAIAGSHSVNGVAELHTKILEKETMHKFYDFSPHKFNNKTNGITHRRWLLLANPDLARLVTSTIGHTWVHCPSELENLHKFAEDPSFQEQFAAIKQKNKEKLAKWLQDNYVVKIDPHSIFDIQIKRIHAYKRQTLNVLHIMHLYNRLKENPNLDVTPRTFIFGGKAAPGYYDAKKTIKLINTLAEVVNRDPDIRDKIKVVFAENYNVSFAELLIPAADVSEQIPTASKEACGTGNMKFMLNGAVTIGTLDGGNIEISKAVGDENIIIFGLNAREVINFYRHGGYSSWEVIHNDVRVKTVLEQLVNGFFPVVREEFRNFYEAFRHYDEFFVLRDFASYVDAQKQVQEKYRDKAKWFSMCVHNVASSGLFSSDRTFSEYALEIWNVKPNIIGEALPVFSPESLFVAGRYPEMPYVQH
ncbi:phosphorylase pyridoxal-phosphate attachment site [Lucifera butyrica]|uniref:Alpha-1,4 glucan phosphorylase n=1 Tax=Lucifera butyrica TaxID=1351585 RepID=A0A498R1F1_9FIRM|nr:glycogen/starch/alpha-glucan phosphorylase [Lucifera butyrica]VBB05039.1 phosphorylase pyridoxal-phosphate attachment site [Lucifera butyrica]